MCNIFTVDALESIQQLIDVVLVNRAYITLIVISESGCLFLRVL